MLRLTTLKQQRDACTVSVAGHQLQLMHSRDALSRSFQRAVVSPIAITGAFLAGFAGERWSRVDRCERAVAKRRYFAQATTLIKGFTSIGAFISLFRQ